MAGIAGDYILDTGTAQSALHETKAQAEGIDGTDLSGGVRVAGMTTPAGPLKVVDRDVRPRNRAGVRGEPIKEVLNIGRVIILLTPWSSAGIQLQDRSCFHLQSAVDEFAGVL